MIKDKYRTNEEYFLFHYVPPYFISIVPSRFALWSKACITPISRLPPLLSGAAEADIDSYGIVLVNGFVCFLIFLYFSGIHSFLHGIQGFQPAVFPLLRLLTGAATVPICANFSMS
jgi:hypothetical protein